jgi:DnaJ-class molecular chaperone
MQYKECPECLGEGEIETETAVADYQCGGYLRGVTVECHVCDGSGEVKIDIFES